MRLFILLGCVAASAAGCDTTKCSLRCSPCSRPGGSCPTAAPVAPVAPAKPTAPAFLPPPPPTIREVRGAAAEDVSDVRTPQAAAPHQDILLIPRVVYVPYSPTPPTRMPATGSQTGPYMQTGDRMTVLPTMSGPMPVPSQHDVMEQVKMQNARIAELEAKLANRSPAPVPMMASMEAPAASPLPQPMPQLMPIPPAK